MLKKEQQELLDLSAELWNKFMAANNKHTAKERQNVVRSKHTPNKGNDLDSYIYSDDLEDFRKAIHTIQRIIQAQGFRVIDGMAQEELITKIVQHYQPTAKEVKSIKVVFRDVKVEDTLQELEVSDKTYGTAQVKQVTQPMGKVKKNTTNGHDDDDFDEDDDSGDAFTG